jgi:hypothetical protein
MDTIKPIEEKSSVDEINNGRKLEAMIKGLME